MLYFQKMRAHIQEKQHVLGGRIRRVDGEGGVFPEGGTYQEEEGRTGSLSWGRG